MTASALAYIRVSSRAQNFSSQESAVKKAAALRGDTIETWYSEKKSAKTIERPELESLRLDARAGRLRGRRLYIFRLDRLTRTGIRDTLAVVEELRNGGCEVVSISDGFDLGRGPASEIVIAVLSWASRMELLSKNERIAAARERMEAEGKSWGRPKRMDARMIHRAVAMRDGGKTIREISAALKVPKSTLGRAIRTSQKQRDVEELHGATPSLTSSAHPVEGQLYTFGPNAEVK